MTRHEREEFGPETQDVIAGLRRLALDAEPPADLLARVKHWCGRPLLPRGHATERRGRFLPPWARRPVVWGPAVAALCFIAGVFVPPPTLTPWPGELPSQASSLAPRGQERAESEARTVPAASSLELTAPIVVTPSPTSSVASPQITITLSPALYEHLLRESQRRQEGLGAVLYEAVVTYLYTDSSE